MIRMSTTSLFEQGVYNLQRGQNEVFRTQDQIATGRRVRTPADDPVAAARGLEVEQAQAISAQYSRNGDSAQSALSATELALSRATSLLQDVRTTAVNAGNGALSSKELNSIASELRDRYQELLGIANSTDGNGLYLFSGYKGTTQPFAETAPGAVQYFGDQGARRVQIGPTRQIPVSEAGSSVFQTIKNGNGTFVSAAASGNTGTGIVNPGTVTDPVAWNATGNPRDFTVVFHVDNSVSPSVTTYDIVDNQSGLSLTTGAAPTSGPFLRTYQSGATISLKRQSPPDTNPTAFDYGADITVQGAPASGDRFTVKASTNEDVFTTLNNLIATLETAQSGPTGNTRLANGINTALSNLDRGLDNLLSVRAAVGARLRETDDAQSSQADQVNQYDKTLSNLRDLDYAKAISDLAHQQLTYEAAQKSFAKVQALTLFDYI
ncbi:MAG TPA: flagellar hook-associated protein FlgL [Burkholderiales bacterium]|nr:flagellar hook-associated protein FlgL [Burkholderiales bacterium]